MPKISVIIPVYNVEKYLSRCLDSVLAQTYKDFEIICVNDGSTDNSLNILNEYAAKDARIKIINQENQGLSEARNTGMRTALGEYICFVDSDDAIHNQLLEINYNLANENSADMVTFAYEKSDGISLNNNKYDKDSIKYIVTDNPIFQGRKGKYRIAFNVWTKFYKKDIIKDIKFIKGIHFEDYSFTYAVLAKKPKTVVTELPLYFYTNNQSSISHAKATAKQIKDYHKGINYIYDIYKTEEFKKELAFIKKDVIPVLLKTQLKKCQKTTGEEQQAMWEFFTEELKDLDNKHLISFPGHSLIRYLTYKRLIKSKA